jgi:molecular chaperone GrpE (heat shock protein)
MWDEEVTKEEGMSITLSKLKKILTIYGVVKIQGGEQ